MQKGSKRPDIALAPDHKHEGRVSRLIVEPVKQDDEKGDTETKYQFPKPEKGWESTGLRSACKERKIKGYTAKEMTKEKIILLLVTWENNGATGTVYENWNKHMSTRLLHALIDDDVRRSLQERHKVRDRAQLDSKQLNPEAQFQDALVVSLLNLSFVILFALREDCLL